MRSKLFVLASLFVAFSMVFTACSAPAQPAPATSAPIIQTVVVEKQVPVEKTVVVNQTVEKIVTPTAPPAKQFVSKDPTTFVYLAGAGEPETLDPALDYETGGGEVLQQVYDTLVFYNKDKPTEFVPQLATKWDVSQDGKTYTFTLRKGVKFHDGSDLTAADVAYVFQRGLLQGTTVSPQWLFAEPILGTGKIDIADAIDSALEDDPENLQKADPAKLKAACQQVQNAIKADNAAGTVTFTLAQPWGPFIATIAGFWGSIYPQKWAVANKAWDGSCDTWQNFYGIDSQHDPLGAIAMGTGPYKFDHWTKGQEWVLKANDQYWRTEPAWPGGPTGAPKMKTLVFKLVNEWGTRFASLQAGDADMAYVDPTAWDQADGFVGEVCKYDATLPNLYNCTVTDPNKPLRKFTGLPSATRTDVFLTFKINVPEGGNPLVGSGKLDGNGIPPDFFSDIHIRRAFNYCFDWDTYNKDLYKGEAVQATTIFLPGQPGYDANAPHYAHDLQKCADEFKASTWKSADGKSLWDIGFRFQAAYNTGNVTRQTISEILASNINQVNSKFVVESLGMPWPAFLQAQRAKTLPMFTSGWVEDIHDSSNWITPYATAAGTYSGRQNLPKELTDKWTTLAQQGVTATSAADRDKIYKQFNQEYYDQAPIILLSNAQGRHYEQRWVQGWYNNPIMSNYYYYAISKK